MSRSRQALLRVALSLSLSLWLCLWPSLGPSDTAFAADEPAGRAAASIATRPSITVPAGSALRTRPTNAAPVVTIVDEETPGELVEERGGWRRVRLGMTTGWLRPEGAADLARAPGSAPEIDRERLARAMALLPEPRVQAAAHGLTIHAPASEALRLERWSTVAARLIETWPRRVGVAELTGELELDGATIVVAPGAESPDDPLDAPGSAGGGVALLRLGERSDDEIEVLLVHELSHLASERAFVRGLPIWLEEGIAEWLAREPLSSDGYGLSGTLRGDITVESVKGGRNVEFRGPLADLVRLAREAREGLLPALDLWTATPESEFSLPASRGTNYALAGSFVRFLFEGDEERAAIVRETLAGAAADDVDVDSELDRRLGDVGELDRSFRAWLLDQYQRETVPAEL